MQDTSSATMLITAEEALKIANYTPYWLHAIELYKKITKLEIEQAPCGEDQQTHFIFALSALYAAGVADGMRIERAKKRERNKNNGTGGKGGAAANYII